jgi:hypothetical protein
MNCFYHRYVAGMPGVSDHAEIAESIPFGATLIVMIGLANLCVMLRPARLCFLVIFTFAVGGTAPSFAMELKVSANTMVLSGEVVARDLDRIKEVFKANPAITHVVLRNSMGGNSWTGYRLGELFREKGVTTAVSGFCVSSCSRLFLGGKVDKATLIL